MQGELYRSGDNLEKWPDLVMSLDLRTESTDPKLILIKLEDIVKIV